MLSRRGLRIKVMQVLYTMHQTNSSDVAVAKRALDRNIHQAYQAYLYVLHFYSLIALQEDLDAHRKKNKYLPTETDLDFQAKLFQNPVLEFLRSNSFFQSKLNIEKVKSLADEETPAIIYHQLKQFQPYLDYLNATDNSEQGNTEILNIIFQNFLSKNEYFDQHMEDIIPTWADDEILVKGMLEDILKAIPFNEHRNEKYFEFKMDADEEELVEILLTKTLEENERYEQLLEPKLKNWDMDRISLIDNILIKMGITEFLYLPTIPVKVTINEYLDISKLYSTPKSKEFINGILDRVMFELKENGELIKTGRGLIG